MLIAILLQNAVHHNQYSICIIKPQVLGEYTAPPNIESVHGKENSRET
jgi:hypothetical protein